MTELMTLQELADYLRVNKRTIYRLLESGSIPAVKIGHNWRFDKTAINEWLRQTSEGAKRRILVVDDDEIIRVLFEKTLEELGHSVTTAESGSSGLKFVERFDFDLVFLDLKMPGMDGAELLRRIRGIKPELLVIVITGYPDSEMMSRALAQGPFGIMNKPFAESDIVIAINSFLQRSKLGRKAKPITQQNFGNMQGIISR